MLGFFIALGGIIITGWLLTRKCRLEEDLPDQIERKSFRNHVLLCRKALVKNGAKRI